MRVKRVNKEVRMEDQTRRKEEGAQEEEEHDRRVGPRSPKGAESE